MKKQFSYLALAGLLLGLNACKNELDDVRVTATPDAAPVVTASTTAAGPLLSLNAKKAAVIYTWTPVKLTLSDGSTSAVPVTYTFEFAKPGTNFAQVGVVPAVTDKTVDTVKVGELNTALLKAGFTPTVPATAEVRLRVTYAGNQSSLFSATSTVTATPYSRDLFAFGAGSSPSLGALTDKSPVLREINGPGKFEGYVWVPAGASTFKFSNTSNASGTVFGAGATQLTFVGGGAEYTLTGPKMYRIRIDQTSSPASLKAEETAWGVVGAATTGSSTGWAASVPMTYDATAKVWKLTDAMLPGTGTGNNEYKFRANDAWAINFGAVSAAEVSKLKQDGDNLLTSGSARYDITLDLNDPDAYTYSLKKK